MINNNGANLSLTVAEQINKFLEYVDGNKINLVATHFGLVIDDKYDYGETLDKIMYFCCKSLSNSIEVLKFIDNGYKGCDKC